MKEFQLISDIDRVEFIKKVNEFLKDGWELHGTTFYVHGANTLEYGLMPGRFCQAMVRR